MKKLLLLGGFVLPVFAAAQSPLTTLPPNNGSGGIFFDLTPISQTLVFTAFQTYFSSAAGSAVAVEVYTRPGSYVGFDGSSAGWTLSETAAATSAGTTTLSGIVSLVNPITLNFGSTTGMYLHATTVGGGIRYQGTGTTSTSNFSNADLQLFSAHSRTGNVAFSGTLFTPRAFSGAIHYTAVPEPATFAAFGVGALFLLRRYRKR